jgi:hypothetical protein
MYTTVTDKAGHIYEVHLSSHQNPPNFDGGMLLNVSSVWVFYDRQWYPSRAKSQMQTINDIKSVSSIGELMVLWSIDVLDIRNK